MKIYFDNIIFSILQSGGISVVWQELLERVISNDIDYQCLEFNNSEKNIFRKRMNISTKRIVKYNYFFFKIQRYCNLAIKLEEPFIFHSSYYRICTNSKAINVTTVHDFTYEYYAKGLRKFIHCKQKHRAIRKSDYIICVSENTKRDLLKFLPDVDPRKIGVIYNGVSDEYFPLTTLDENWTLPYLPNSYLVFIGARGWYKRFDFAISIVEETNKNLIIVGGELTKDEKYLLDKNLKGRYTCVGRVSNENLNKIYNGAFALLYTSEYEGFGIPVLEAQKAGCPVIALNTSSIPEVISDKSLLLNSPDKYLAINILQNLEDKNYRTDIISKGFYMASKFTWDKMAQQIIEVYQNLYEKKEI